MTKWSVLSGCKTILCFLLALCIISVFTILFPVIKIIRKCWLDVLKFYYPQYTFSASNSIRSTVETKRNPGIIHFILKVSGEVDIDVVRAKYIDNILERRNADSALIYPKFQSILKRFFGFNVWENQSGIDVAQNIILGATTYRGRPVSEYNIQLVLSEVVSKYLPANLPPWQIIIIPVQKPNESYTTILFRIHHLLLTDQPNLKISDLLLIDRMYRVVQQPEEANNDVVGGNKSNALVNYDQSPFNNVLPSNLHLSEVASRITTRISNCWNESRYKLFMSSANGRGPESLWELSKCVAITFVSVGQKFLKNIEGVETKFYLDYLWKLIRKETQKNNLNFSAIKLCCYNAILDLNPVTIIFHLVSLQLAVFKWFFLELPIFFLTEVKEFVLWFRNGCCDQYPETVIGYFLINCPTFYRALLEVLQYFGIILEGPRRLCDLISETPEYNTLQETQSCGRKIIAWSEKIDLKRIEQLIDDNGQGTSSNQSDLILTWLAASIKECLENFPIQTNSETIPESVQVSARCVYQECLLGNMNRAEGGVDGIFCFNLPLGTGNRRHLLQMRNRLREARDDNMPLYSMTRNERRQGFLAEMLSPHWVKLMTNYLSRKYSVTITDIVTRSGSIGADQENGHRTLWGAEVLEFDYFRPPVANTKLSITLQRYRNYIRIGVLADAELSPVHQKIISSWPEFINGWVLLLNK